MKNFMKNIIKKIIVNIKDFIKISLLSKISHLIVIQIFKKLFHFNSVLNFIFQSTFHYGSWLASSLEYIRHAKNMKIINQR